MKAEIARLDRRIDDLDIELEAAQDMVVHAFWPALAVAFALIEKGVLDRGELLVITELLHHHLATQAETGRAHEQLHALDEFRAFLSDPAWSAGQVVQELRKAQSVDGANALLRALLESRKRPPE